MSNPGSVEDRLIDMTQRTIYKLVDALLSTQVDDPQVMLSGLVDFIVDSDRLVMSGGRLWELEPGTDWYVLRYQNGEFESLQVGARRSVADMPGALALAKRATLTTEPVDMGERGSRVYSLTGIGDPVSSPSGPLPPYAVAFTARELNDEFVDTMLVVSSAATTALRNRLSDQRSRKLQKDLDTAWRIQHGLVPDHQRTFRDYDIFGVSIPDSVVGGDYFDYLNVSDEEDRLGLVVSDAASKGLPAAVQALFVSGALRMGVSFETKMSALVSRLNQLIYDTFPNERFVSLFYAELTASRNGLVLYVNAGHCPPLHYIAATGTIEELPPTGGILGIIEDQPFTVENVNLAPGDRLVLFTDGITEAQNASGELFGEHRLRSLLLDHAEASSEALCQHVLDAVNAHAVNAAYTDDKTIVVVTREAQ